jgi:hypothetical protein
MEIIWLSEYGFLEKVAIVEQYLVPKSGNAREWFDYAEKGSLWEKMKRNNCMPVEEWREQGGNIGTPLFLCNSIFFVELY